VILCTISTCKLSQLNLSKTNFPKKLMKKFSNNRCQSNWMEFLHLFSYKVVPLNQKWEAEQKSWNAKNYGNYLGTFFK